MRQLTFVFRRLHHKVGYGLWIGSYDSETKLINYAPPTDIIIKDDTTSESFHLPEPTLEFSGPLAKDAIEDLVFQMSLEGIKIKAQSESSGAMKDHIKDLRSIVTELVQKV